MDGAQRGAPSCNLDFLETSLGRNRATALRLVGLFLDSYPQLLRRLHEAVAANDLERLCQVVHDIRGNCVLFSAQECLSKTVRLEVALRAALKGTLAASGESVDWAAEVADLQRSLERIAVDLREYRGRGEQS